MLMLISEVTPKKIVQSYAKDIRGVRYLWHILYVTQLKVIDYIFDTKNSYDKKFDRNKILLEYKLQIFNGIFPKLEYFD